MSTDKSYDCKACGEHFLEPDESVEGFTICPACDSSNIVDQNGRPA